MNEKARLILTYAIGLVFLAGGGIRLGVSTLLIMQSQGVLSFADLQAGLNEVSQFMAKTGPQALVPFTDFHYLVYLWLMGATLFVGAIGCLIRKPFGLPCLYAFLTLWVMLFVNFQTINPKILHLMFFGLLTLVFRWLVTTDKQNC